MKNCLFIKCIILFIMFLSFADLTYGQKSRLITLDIPWGSVYGQSSDGRYLAITAGLSDYDMQSYLYDTKTETLTYLGNSSTREVSNDGIVVGRFLDKSIKVDGQAIYSGGWWKDGQWHSLGLHPNYGADKITIAGGSMGSSITPDGKIISGYCHTSSTKLVPCTWNLNAETGEVSNFIEFKTEFSDQNGAHPHGMSENGQRLCGWSYMVGDVWLGSWVPTFWKDKNTTFTVPKEMHTIGTGFLRAMNNAGTKACGHIGGQGIVLNEDGSCEMIGVTKWRNMSEPNEMFKQGIMVGNYDDIWTEEYGIMQFSKYVSKVWGVDLTGYGAFGLQNVSDDGRHFAGGCMDASYNFLPFTVILEGYPLPLPVEKVVTELNEENNNIKISWDKPLYNGYPIVGYDVYRNDTKINNEILKNVLEFEDANAPLGINGYHVIATYSFDGDLKLSDKNFVSYVEVIEPGGCFSPKDLKSNIVYNRTVNFTWSLPKANYNRAGAGVKGYNLYKNGVCVNSSLLTERKYTDVIMEPGEYTFAVNAVFENDCSSNQSLPVTVKINPIGTCQPPKKFKAETLRGNALLTWQAPNSPGAGINPVGYNIYRNGVKVNTDLVKGLSYSDNNLEMGQYSYQIDAFFDNSCESAKTETVTIGIEDFNPVVAPKNLSLKTSAGNIANLNWDTPELGDYKTLRWYSGAVERVMGRVEGGDLFVACLWDKNDLSQYFNYTLSDIEFYAAYNIAHTFYIYLDDQLVATQTMANVNANEFNMIRLENPVLIERGKSLKVAYKISTNPGTWVVGADNNGFVDGKGNLMSEDGINWYNASKDGATGNWAITIRLMPYSVAASKKLDYRFPAFAYQEPYMNIYPGIKLGSEVTRAAMNSTFVNDEVTGYNVYRNGVQINSEFVTENNYKDVMLSNTNNCYTVEALFTNGRVSNESNEVCSYGECSIPENLTGKIGDAPEKFELSWDRPVQNNGNEIVKRYHNGEYRQAIGFPQTIKYYALAKWTPFDMVDMENCVLSKIEVYVYKKCKFALAAFQGGELILLQEVKSMEEGKFNTYEIENGGISIDPNKELLVGVYVNGMANQMNLGMDEGPAVADRGDLISFDGKQFNAISAMSEINANWNITAVFTQNSKKSEVLTFSIPLPKADDVDLKDLNIVSERSDNKSSSAFATEELLVGYNVYRNGMKINKSYITDENFVDLTLEDGKVYNYQVTAFWNTGCESGLSNSVSNVPNVLDELTGGELKVYPNPAKNVISIDGQWNNARIYDLSGKCILNVVNTEAPINVSGLKNGAYFIEVTGGNGDVQRNKIIISK